MQQIFFFKHDMHFSAFIHRKHFPVTIMTNVLHLIYRFFCTSPQTDKNWSGLASLVSLFPPLCLKLKFAASVLLIFDWTLPITFLSRHHWPLASLSVTYDRTLAKTYGLWSLTSINEVDICTSWHPRPAEISDTTLCLQKISGGVWWCRCLCTQGKGRRGELHSSVPLGETNCKKSHV